jgi:GGDEF domain-containing protein
VRAGFPSDRLPEPLSDLRFTFSAGVTESLPHDDRSSTLYRADRALYEAKPEGRNCTRIGFEQETSMPRKESLSNTIK